MSQLLRSFLPIASNRLLNVAVQKISKRSLFAYLRIAFNKVDTVRLQEVGPDRLCAEWILKNGGTVQFADIPVPITDYNTLEQDKVSVSSRLRAIDATDSAIMDIGFEHLKGCKYIERIILHRCKHMENDALTQLTVHCHIDALRDLQVTECGNVEDSGLLALRKLVNLKKLTIYGFEYVKDFPGVCNELKRQLPDCKIITKDTADNKSADAKA